MNRPNILWICTDQQRWDTISCLGFKGTHTPNIDALAASGVVFSKTYCQSPICTPSRATFLTGLYPIAHQIHRNGNKGYPGHYPLLPKLLQDAGYHTGLIGKLHLSRTQDQTEIRHNDGYEEFYWSQHPFPDWGEHHDYRNWIVEQGVDPEELYKAINQVCAPGIPAKYHQNTWAADRGTQFITANRDRTWFLSINIDDPHPPFCPPPEYFHRFKPEDMPDPIFAPSDVEHQARFAEVDQQARRVVDPSHLDPDADFFETTEGVDGALHDTAPTSYDAKQIRAAYHGMITHVDDMIAKLLQTLDETGQRENTVIVFMSDHGEMLGDHGLIYKGCRFYEGLVHVPLVISWPGVTDEGRVSNALVELVDLPATLMEIATQSVPEHMQGLSLVPLLQNSAANDFHKPYVLSEYFDALNVPGGHGSRGSMYFDGRHKLNLYHDIGEGELFDHDADSREVVDLFHDPASANLVRELTLRHFAAMMRVSGAGPERQADY